MSSYSNYDLQTILQQMVGIAERAGLLILKYYKSKDLSFQFKEDGSRVSVADIKTDQYIRNELKSLCPRIPIISEESCRDKDRDLSACKNFWLVDPIDGTDGFISQNDDFVVNIALIEDRKPVVGVVHSPILKKTYGGGLRIGTSVYGGHKPVETLKAMSSVTKGLQLLLYHDLPFNEERDSFLKRINVSNVKNDSNMLRFCRIAEGEVDLHVCFEGTREWDIAAGHAILNGVEGRIVDLAFKEIVYGKKDFKNPSFLAQAKICLPKFIGTL